MLSIFLLNFKFAGMKPRTLNDKKYIKIKITNEYFASGLWTAL